MWNLRDGFLEHIIHDSGSEGGIGDAFNRGVARASGDWAGILNADDWYTEATFNHIAPHLDRQFTILHGMIRQHRLDGSTRVTGKRNHDPKHHFRSLKTMPAQHPTCFVHRRVYEQVGQFDTACSIAMDYDFLLRAHLANAEFIYIPEVITNFTVGRASSVMPLVGMREMWQSKKLYTGQIIRPTLWYFLQWLKWRNYTPRP